jgi:hypothetical protein
MQTKSSPLSLSVQKFSYRFAEQVLNSKLATKEEIEQVLLETIPDITKLSRPAFNKLLLERFLSRGCVSNLRDEMRPPRTKKLLKRANVYFGEVLSVDFEAWRGVIETTLYSRSLLSPSSTCSNILSFWIRNWAFWPTGNKTGCFSSLGRMR